MFREFTPAEVVVARDWLSDDLVDALEDHPYASFMISQNDLARWSDERVVEVVNARWVGGWSAFQRYVRPLVS